MMSVSNCIECDIFTKDSTVELFNCVDGRIMSDGIHTITVKYGIGRHDFYLKTGWFDGRMVLIDITVGNDSSYDNNKLDLDITKYNLLRAMTELVCRQATSMLQSGVFSVYDVISGWFGVEGFPGGVCEMTQSIQKGPLSAAAVIIKENYNKWQEKAMMVERRRG